MHLASRIFPANNYCSIAQEYMFLKKWKRTHVVYATSAKSFFSLFRLLRQNDVTQDSSSSFLSFANPFFFCAITQNEKGRKRRRKKEEQQKKQFAQLPH